MTAGRNDGSGTTAEDPRICCVEANYEYGGEEPTIKPMLEMLSQWGYWPHVHLQCGTADLAKAFLREKWHRSAVGSVLLFAVHGSPGCITLSELSGDQSISLECLARSCLAGACRGRYVHFSACNVFENRGAAEDYQREIGATAVSWYGEEVGWAEADKPALLADLMLLNALSEAEINFCDRSDFRPKLGQIERDMQERFFDCQFEMVCRRD